MEEVATACGFLRTSYYRWETLRAWPNPVTLTKLAEFYNIEPTEFFKPIPKS